KRTATNTIWGGEVQIQALSIALSHPIYSYIQFDNNPKNRHYIPLNISVQELIDRFNKGTADIYASTSGTGYLKVANRIASVDSGPINGGAAQEVYYNGYPDYFCITMRVTPALHLSILSIDYLPSLMPLDSKMPHLRELTIGKNIIVNVIERFKSSQFERIRKLQISIADQHSDYIIEELFRIFPLTQHLICKSPIRSQRIMNCRSITRAYYRNSVGVLLIYDTINYVSFTHVTGWLNEARAQIQPYQSVFLLVCTKLDRES
ncbi:unnamed protein product, partial [Rotaria sordida]